MEYGMINGHTLVIVLLTAGTSTEVLGIIAMLIGLTLLYWVYRRRFNRRNGAGLQTFRNFEHRVITAPLEWIIKILGLAIILLGIFFFLAGYAEKGNAEKNAPSHNHKNPKDKI